MERATMPSQLVDEVCSALGIAVPTDLAGVTDLYTGWVAAVPFDPVSKAEAQRLGLRPPGDDPAEVAQRWLATGLGSTCWGHTTVLAAILQHAGVETTIGIDRMLREDAVDFHSFLLAHVEDDRYLIDPIHASGQLLRFEPGAVGTHPAYRVGLELDEHGRLIHWFASGSGDEPTQYVVLSTTLDVADVRAFLDVSVTHSGVGRDFFLRRALPDRMIRLRRTEDGSALRQTVSTAKGETTILAADLDQAIALTGYRPEAFDHLVASGLLRPGSAQPWAQRT